jgi:hypothetical protein
MYILKGYGRNIHYGIYNVKQRKNMYSDLVNIKPHNDYMNKGSAWEKSSDDIELRKSSMN